MRARFTAEGDVVIVTGAASGISLAVANACVASGATVIGLDVSERPTALSGEVYYHTVDVSNHDRMMDMGDQVRLKHGLVTGLVCGAVVQPRTPVLATGPDEWRRVQSVNLDGVLWSLQAFVPSMIEGGGGAVVVFTSGIATSGWPRAAAYTSTKGAAHGLARSLAAEVSDHRVRVNLISPGVVDTPQYRNANVGQDRDHWEKTTGVGTTDDVVGPILFLLSDAATMTGSLLTREQVYSRES